MYRKNCIFILKNFLNSKKLSPYTFITHNSLLKYSNDVQNFNLVNKFLKREVKLKNSLEPAVEVSYTPNKRKKVRNYKGWRQLRLDKCYLEKITDILTTHEFGSVIFDLKVEIIQAQVQPSLSSLHIYWACQENSRDEEINKIFATIAPLLRYQLSLLNLFGRIPPIIFIKDTYQQRVAEVEKRLAIADYGEDFKPSTPAHHVIPHQTINKAYEENILKTLKEKSKKLIEKELDCRGNDDKLPEDIPILHQNIYRLDRQRIIKSILIDKAASKGNHRKTEQEISLDYQSSIITTGFKGQKIFNEVKSTGTADIRKWALQFKNKVRKEAKADFKEDYISYEEEVEIPDEDFNDYDESQEDIPSSSDYWLK